MTTVQPASGRVVKVGVAFNASTLNIQIQELGPIVTTTEGGWAMKWSGSTDVGSVRLADAGTSPRSPLTVSNRYPFCSAQTATCVAIRTEVNTLSAGNTPFVDLLKNGVVFFTVSPPLAGTNLVIPITPESFASGDDIEIQLRFVATGPVGPSAFVSVEVAVEFEGIAGPTGAAGPTGSPGLAGATGATGPAGPSGGGGMDAFIFDPSNSGGVIQNNGSGNSAPGQNALAEGHSTTASGVGAHAEGFDTLASGGIFNAGGAHAEGHRTTASGNFGAHAEGDLTTASGAASHAEGDKTTASGGGSHAEGFLTTASGDSSHAEGTASIASAREAHAEGFTTVASGAFGAHAEGSGTLASGPNSHAEGNSTIASGPAAHAEGNGAIASGPGSHAEGLGTIASGDTSHAEGSGTTASNFYSHAEGQNTTASGPTSHAEGSATVASGDASHAENFSTTASGSSSHAEGHLTVAVGVSSHAQGAGSVALRVSQDALASGFFASPGDAQTSRLVFRGSTPGVANNESVELKYGLTFSDDQSAPEANETFQLEDSKTYAVKVVAACGGIQGLSDVTAVLELSFSARRSGGGSSIQGAQVTAFYGDADAATWTLTASIGAAPDRVVLTFSTGGQGPTSLVNVAARVEFTEVVRPTVILS